jgi:hypothetical protein
LVERDVPGRFDVIESDRPAPDLAEHAPAVVNHLEVYRCEPEAVFTVPPLVDDDPPLEIGIAAAGGGTVGRAYANNDWIYGVWLSGSLVCSGVDLRSGCIARTHRFMAAALAEYSATARRPHPR